jgi:hypothetical protein
MVEKLDGDGPPERPVEKVEAPQPAGGSTEATGSQTDERSEVSAAVRAEFLAAERIHFTHPTYPNGTPRPGHTAPEQHRYTPNDPENPKAGYRRGPGEPLDS